MASGSSKVAHTGSLTRQRGHACGKRTIPHIAPLPTSPTALVSISGVTSTWTTAGTTGQTPLWREWVEWVTTAGRTVGELHKLGPQPSRPRGRRLRSHRHVSAAQA